MNTREWIEDIDEEILLADGFEEALVGICEIAGNAVALYDKKKCIEILMEQDEVTEEEAEDYFQYNVQGSYVGEKTPAFMTRFPFEEEVKMNG